jgi:hypothetical protein
MWVIHFVGAPQSGKSVIARKFFDLLHPFVSSIGSPIRIMEMGQMVQDWYSKIGKDPKADMMLYKEEAPKELLNIYHNMLSPVAVNIVVGVREQCFLDLREYRQWGEYLKQNPSDRVWQLVVHVMASKAEREKRAHIRLSSSFASMDEAEQQRLSFLDSVWQLKVNNETARDLLEAPLTVLYYMLTHTALSQEAAR